MSRQAPGHRGPTGMPAAPQLRGVTLPPVAGNDGGRPAVTSERRCLRWTAPSSPAGAPSASRSFSTRPTALDGTTCAPGSTTNWPRSSQWASGSSVDRPASRRTGLPHRPAGDAAGHRRAGGHRQHRQPRPATGRDDRPPGRGSAGGHRAGGPAPGARSWSASPPVPSPSPASPPPARTRVPGDAALRHEALHRTGPARPGQLGPQPGPALPGLRPDPLGEAAKLRGDRIGYSARPRRHGRRHPAGRTPADHGRRAARTTGRPGRGERLRGRASGGRSTVCSTGSTTGRPGPDPAVAGPAGQHPGTLGRPARGDRLRRCRHRPPATPSGPDPSTCPGAR